MSTINKKIPRFISDHVAEKDLFGAHSKIADSILNIINSDAEIRTMGILGPWGSGKSTILKLVADQLDTRDTLFYIYDAWLHQSDPPRRSFLESLIAYAKSTGKITPEQWDDDLNRISGREEERTTHNMPHLTIWGVILVFSLLLLPAAYKLINLEKFTELSNICGIILIISPFLILLMNFMWYRPSSFWRTPISKLIKRDYWRQSPDGKTNLINLFINKSVNTTVTKVIKTPDPTAIEFYNIFRKIIGELSLQNTKIILVIDNLDRIPGAEASKIWSTIRTFLSDNELGADFIERNNSSTLYPWVIVPVDRGSIKNIFTETHGDACVQAFIDKTFDVVFNIETPVMSDWQRFLNEKLQFAYTNVLENKELNEISRICSLSRTDENSSFHHITPRKIHFFINKLSGLIMQWDNIIPVATLAYYSLREEAFSSGIGSIIDKDFGRSYLFEYDANCRQNIAAIFHTIDPNEAFQIFINEQLEIAINSHDDALFKKCVQTPEFLNYFETYISEQALLAHDGVFVFNCTHLMLVHLGDDCNKNDITATIWQKIAAMYKSISKLGTIEHSKDCIVQIVSNYPEIADKIIQLAGKYCNENPRLWCDLVFTCIHSASEEIRNRIYDTLSVPGDSNNFIEVLDIAINDDTVKNDSTLASSLSPSELDSNELTKAILERNISEPFNNKVFDRLRFITKNDNTLLECNRIASELDAKISSSNLDENFDSMKCMLLLAPKYDEIAAKLKQIVSRGVIHSKCSQLQNQNNVSVMSLLIVAIMKGYPEIRLPNMPNVSQVAQLIGKYSVNDISKNIADFVKIIGNSHYLDIIADAAFANNQWNELAKGVYLTRIEQGFGTLNLRKIFKDMGRYINLIGDDNHKDFIRQLLKYEKFWERIELCSDEDFARTIQLLFHLGTDNLSTARAFYKRISDKNTEFWNAEFGRNGIFICLLIESSKVDEIFDLGTNFYNALNSNVNSIISSSDSNISEKYWEEYYLLFKFVSKEKTNVILANALDAMKAETTPVHGKVNGVRYLYKAYAADSIILNKKSDEIARQILLPIFSSLDIVGIKTVLSFYSIVERVISGANDTTKEAIRERFVEMYNDDMFITMHEQIKDISKKLGLRQMRKKGLAKGDGV